MCALVVVAVTLAACSSPPPVVSAPTTIGIARTTTPPSPPPSTTTTLPKLSGFLAQSASFVTANDGYVLGVVPCSSGACLALRHTNDRGASWTTVTPPPTTLGDASNTTGVSNLQFADTEDGWAFGPALWATHDGGIHWQTVDIGGTVVAMGSGAGTAYAVVVEPCQSGEVQCGYAGHLFRSPAGQDHWTEVPNVSGQFAPDSSSLVVEGQTVYLLTSYPNSQLLSSSDGIHFAPLAIPCSPKANQIGPFVPTDVAASDPDDVAVACLGGAGAGSQQKEVFISHDGGHTYEGLPEPPMGGDGAELAMPAPSTLLVGSSSAASWVYRIVQSVPTWTMPVSFPDGGVGLGDLTFVDPAHGVFIHAMATVALSILSSTNRPTRLGTLYETDDGGVDWYPVNIPT